MIRSTREMSNETLLVMAAHGDHAARTERLIREIMVVDALEWPDAAAKADEMAVMHSAGSSRLTVVKGISAAGVGVAGLCTIPMVFGHDTALWFNDAFVGFVPPPENELQDFLEVGAWTWSWMEPPLGTISFLILCFQWSREQLAVESVFERRRIARVLATHPAYDLAILTHWAKTLPMDAELESQAYAERRRALIVTSAATNAV